MKRKEQVVTEKNDLPLNTPGMCLACRHPEVASFPVHLTEMDGTVTLVCYVARCNNCGYIKNYGMFKGIYKLNGKIPDFNMKYWPELRRNDITPGEFIDAILEAAKEPRSIWLDARNGLLQAEPEGDQAELLKRFHALVGG